MGLAQARPNNEQLSVTVRSTGQRASLSFTTRDSDKSASGLKILKKMRLLFVQLVVVVGWWAVLCAGEDFHPERTRL